MKRLRMQRARATNEPDSAWEDMFGILLLGVVGWGLRRRRKVAMGRG